MDSVTQAVLGAVVAESVFNARPYWRTRFQDITPIGRKATVIGAVLGTLPDLDVFIDYGNVVNNTVMHRGFSHSLWVLSLMAIPIAWLIYQGFRLYSPQKPGYRRTLLATWLCLITHPLIDALTVYGTQLYWPSSEPPVIWSVFFIIDPVYTLSLLAGLVMAFVYRSQRKAWYAVMTGLLFSSGYMAWAFAAQGYITQQASAWFKTDELLVSPTAFNTIAWRVLVPQGDRVLESYWNVLQADAPMDMTVIDKGLIWQPQIQGFDSFQKLQWFSHGYYQVSKQDEQIRVSDLRMGGSGQYIFTFVIGEVNKGQVTPTLPVQLDRPSYQREDWQQLYRYIFQPELQQAALK